MLKVVPMAGFGAKLIRSKQSTVYTGIHELPVVESNINIEIQTIGNTMNPRRKK
jgi:hypothetical protein